MSADAKTTEILANCLWWMEKEATLPSEPAARERQWRRERMAWLETAERLVLHLDYNGIDLRSRQASRVADDEDRVPALSEGHGEPSP